MGVFGAMQTAITGLRAQATALGHISNNIANSQTTGYKRSDTTFSDLVPGSPARQQALGVVQAFSRPTNTVQGDITKSEVRTFMGINGDGYFIVGAREDTVDGLPIFSDEELFTRRGDFELDRNGYLVNGAGYYLKGLGVDATTGNVVGSVPDFIQVTNDFLPATATTQIEYEANLASVPKTSSYDPAIPNSELLASGSYAVDPRSGGAGVVQAGDNTLFLAESIAGGAVTAHDALGASVDVQFRWAKVDSVASGGSDTWNLFYLADSAATGAATMWTNVGQDYTFNAQGVLNPALPSVTITGLTVNGTALGNIPLIHSAGMSQFADSSGSATITNIDQNGSSAGEFSGISVSEEGRIIASYTNGRVIEVAEVTLANFLADGFLEKADGNAFRETIESGTAILGSQGKLVGAALEASNTDIADEFSKLIVTQQAYAANTRVISTGEEMLQEVLNMLR
jgi:flagellar hook protein FlgE